MHNLTYRDYIIFSRPQHSPAVMLVSAEAVRAVIPLSHSLVGKARGCDIDFLRCSFRLFPLQPHDGEMPSPKIGSLPGFFERFIRPKPLSAAIRITNKVTLISICSGGAGWRDLRLMERWRKRGSGPCFEHFVSERRQTRGWNGRRECDSVR